MVDDKRQTTRPDISEIAARATWTPVEYEMAWDALSDHDQALLRFLWNQPFGVATDEESAQLQQTWGHALWNTAIHQLERLNLISRTQIQGEDGTSTHGWMLEPRARELLAWRTDRDVKAAKLSPVGRRDRLRQLLLRRIYDTVGPSGHGLVKEIALAAAKEVGGAEQDAEEAFEYLMKRDFFEDVTTGWGVSLSPSAVDLVEEAIRKEAPERPPGTHSNRVRPDKSRAEASGIKKGEKVFGDWVRTTDRVGTGGQGDVFLAYRKEDAARARPHVIKLLRNPARVARFEKEVRAALKLEHVNILKVVDHDLEAQRPYLVTPYYARGELTFRHMDALSPAERMRFFATVSHAVGFAHLNGITHRDLKPENILLDEDGGPVVADFGICFINEENRATESLEAVGSRFCTPPELEDGRAETVTPAADVYCLGKLLYWMFAGRSFQREKHRDGDLDLTKKPRLTTHAFVYELLDRMIVSDPEKRFRDANEVAVAAEALATRIAADAHVLDLRVPQACHYCWTGNYEVVVDPRWWKWSGERGPGEKLQQEDGTCRMYGVGSNPGAPWLVLHCNHCGNLQRFQLFGRPGPQQAWRF